MISIIIPFKSDNEELPKVLEHLLSTSNTLTDNTEIIVVNDGSLNHFGKFVPLEVSNPNIKVINNSKTFGVGYAFDRGVEQALYDTIILMGCDVFPKEGWYEKVISAVETNPNSIGCAVCVGDKPPYTKHYGADMLFTVGNDDLPKDSKLRERKGGYTSLFKAKWRPKESDTPYELPCLLGAFYFTTKAYYKSIGGWDTVKGDRNKGFRSWGHLEPYISLKSWLVGGGCYFCPDIEVTHIFNRVNRENRWSKGGRSAEFTWWNALLILETMIMSEHTRNRLYDFVNPELNFNVARQMIKRNYDYVKELREANRLKFKLEIKEYMDKFNIKI